MQSQVMYDDGRDPIADESSASVQVEDLNLEGVNIDVFDLWLDDNDQPVSITFYEHAPVADDPESQGTGLTVNGSVTGTANFETKREVSVAVNLDAQGRRTGSTVTTTVTYTRGTSGAVSAGGTISGGGLIKRFIRFFRQ